VSAEVIADTSGKWCGNALRVATREEAEANVRDLMMRWFAVRETRVVESDDPVNYRSSTAGSKASHRRQRRRRNKFSTPLDCVSGGVFAFCARAIFRGRTGRLR
jgi:hypothetical protein